MTLEVIGAGFGRTGTLSLKIALEKLGFERCYHMAELMQHPHHVQLWQLATRGEPIDWPALYQGYRASVDWPSCNFWEIQLRQFPDARVILTERDPERHTEGGGEQADVDLARLRHAQPSGQIDDRQAAGLL